MAENPKKPSISLPIYYVIVIHGIGEQKLNSTVTPVINRFAEVRNQPAVNGQTSEPFKDLVSWGMVSAQTGHPRKKDGQLTFSRSSPWAEFDNIRIDGQAKERFQALPATSGENIRFVELYWADILNENYDLVGQDIATWAPTLMARLENRKQEQDLWLYKLLEQLQATLLFLDKILAWQAPGVKKLVFEKFLGDVQIYGESPWVRGQAVGRFHNLMDKLQRHHQQRNPQQEARYMILSHSLGTVLALDALAYGHCKKKIYLDPPQENANFPFQGYFDEYLGTYPQVDEAQEALGAKWIHQVDALITLGSPIDKFITLWPLNYEYLHPNLSSEEESIFVNRTAQIKHYNYCDEQDPVGHKTELLRSKAVYHQLFVNREEEIFNRYVIPGYAHNRYWKDTQLFQKITQQVIDQSLETDQAPPSVPAESTAEIQLSSQMNYWKTAFNSYWMIPLTSIPLTSLFFLLGWHSVDKTVWEFSVFFVFLLIAISFVFRRMISLAIWWQQIFRLKSYHHDQYIQRRSLQVFTYLTLSFLGLITFLTLFYASGSLHYFRHQLAQHRAQIIYILSLMVVSALILVIQYVSSKGRMRWFFSRFWTVTEVKTLFVFFSILGLCWFLSGNDLFAKYFLYPDVFYLDELTIILLNTNLTSLYTAIAYYDVRREIRDLKFH